MKRSKLTESQIVAMLNEGQAGVKVEDICRQYCQPPISETV
ncbi:hypothetical protein PsalN5692_01240 [Piscirickettsia salmonis]|nr:hypothetical protein [Piscirickettsia salmonis]QGP49787.1 hypothetical protein PsalN5692_01240 [Piscirickettsia salmonis]